MATAVIAGGDGRGRRLLLPGGARVLPVALEQRAVAEGKGR